MKGYNKGGLVKPTLEEVKEYFKDAKIVKCASDAYGAGCGLFDITKFTDIIETNTEILFGKDEFDDTDNDQFVTLFNTDNGYAEIIEYKSKPMKKVIRLDQPKEEGEKSIELTHYINNSGRWSQLSRSFDGYDKIVYLGHCNTGGDKFACYHAFGKIEIWKGHLNDGVY